MNTDKIRWGTTAIHKMGDISREDGDYFRFGSEDDENYIGHWLTGFGFVNVKFPKSTSRDLTDDERTFLACNRIVIA